MPSLDEIGPVDLAGGIRSFGWLNMEVLCQVIPCTCAEFGRNLACWSGRRRFFGWLNMEVLCQVIPRTCAEFGWNRACRSGKIDFQKASWL